MPEFHNNILCVKLQELGECGVSVGYLKIALCRQRKGEVYCWEHHKEGKQVYLHYHNLQTKYKLLIKTVLCDGLEPEIYLRNKEEQKARAAIETIADQLTSLVISDPADIEHLTKTGLFTPTEIHQLARGAAWLKLLNDVDVKRARSLGFDSIVTLRSEVFKRCLNEQTAEPTPLIRFKKGLITNERVLLLNAQKYKAEGIQCLIHKGTGNVNREKGDAAAHAKLIVLASNPVKYSWEDVAMMYNDWALENKKPELSTSAIKQYLYKPKVKKVWFYNRHGKLAADNEMQQLINRDKPSFPDALWSLDGTTMQLYYRGDDGKIKSDLYTYFVTDANTGTIIGHSIAYAETSGMVEEALRNAVNKHEYKPYQLQYDNSSANTSVVIKNLMSNMSRVHFACEPYKGRSKYVEGIIGHFQQRVLRKYEAFKGGNITSPSLNSKANPELLAKFKKNPELLYSLEEIIIEFNKAVIEWNNRGEKRDSYGRFVGESKISRYLSIAHEKRSKINYFDRLSLFMIEQKTPYAYGTNGIEIEINGHQYKYRVPDPNDIGDFMFANEHLMEKFTVKMDREKPEMIALYQDGKFITHAYEMERYASCVADLKEGEKAKQVAFKAKQEEFGQQYATRELERQMEILGELKATGTDGFGWWDSSKLAENNRENQLEDNRNGISDGLTEKQRRILNVGR